MVVHKVVMLGDGGVGKTAFVIQVNASQMHQKKSQYTFVH